MNDDNELTLCRYRGEITFYGKTIDPGSDGADVCSECGEPWKEEDGYMAEDGWCFCASCIEQASYDLGYSWWITVGVL